MAAPRRPLDDPARPERLAGGSRSRRPRRAVTTSNPRSLGRAGSGHEALEEQVAERLVVAVQLAVGRDDRRAAARRAAPDPPRAAGATRSRAKRSASAVASRLERDRRRQAPVVERDDDAPAAAELDPVRPAGVESSLGGLPRREDRVPDALLGAPRAASAGRPRPRAATSRPAAGRSAARSRGCPRRSRSAGRRPRRAAGSCGGTAGRSPALLAADEPGEVGASASASHCGSVGPRSHEIRPRLPRSAFGR